MSETRYITVSDAARRFGRSAWAFRKAAYRGTLVTIKPGREYLTTLEDAADYVARVAASGVVTAAKGDPRRRQR